MTNTVDADTLRKWLDAQQPVTVLDVRSDEDRAQWAIPGSGHVRPTMHYGWENSAPLPGLKTQLTFASGRVRK